MLLVKRVAILNVMNSSGRRRSSKALLMPSWRFLLTHCVVERKRVMPWHVCFLGRCFKVPWLTVVADMVLDFMERHLGVVVVL